MLAGSADFGVNTVKAGLSGGQLFCILSVFDHVDGWSIARSRPKNSIVGRQSRHCDSSRIEASASFCHTILIALVSVGWC